MRQLFALVLICTFAFSRVSAECNGKVSPNSYVGDVSVEDFAVELNNGWVSLPELNLGTAYQSFELDVFSTAASGCLFSFGTPNTPQYIEARINNRVVEFVVGNAAQLKVATSGIPVFDLNRWQHLSFHVSNAAEANATLYIDNLRVAPDVNNPAAKIAIAGIALGSRLGAIGKCASLAPVTAVDNFFVTSSPRTLDDIQDTLKQFFPVLPENDLVAYFGFNEAEGPAKSMNGKATNNWLQATIGGGAVRKLRNAVSTAGLQTTDRFCQYGGTVLLSEGTRQNAPWFGYPGGGFTNTLDCSAPDEPALAINQRWDDNGAVIGVSVFSHVRHRWRVSPGPNIKVERADWGGWLEMAEAIGVIEEDRSTYIVGKNEFQLQIAGVGWVRVSLQSPTSLSYQYAIASSRCATAATRNVCSHKTGDRSKFNFLNVPMIEPMGLTAVTAGVGNLPATLACPTPSFEGPYPGDPYTYCDYYKSRPYYGSEGDRKCCQLANRDFYWCPPSREKCWNTPNFQHDHCCADHKYASDNNPSSARLMYCPINQDDCWLGAFVQECCQSDPLRVKNGNVHEKCLINERDCFDSTVTVTDSKCCTWNHETKQGLRYYKGGVKRFPTAYCPLEENDCWTAPGNQIQSVRTQCCGSNYRFRNKWRLDYCPPRDGECWLWYTDKSYPKQEDPKCCTPEHKFYKNADGVVIALPWCSLSNEECWNTKGLVDQRCCASDALKYFKKPDGTYDYTRRIQYCEPTVDDCWGWETNPAKFPVRVEDQRCCEKKPTRYHPDTLKRLDYCEPWFEDCWGFYVQGSLRDQDERCCKSFPTHKNERLPYCPPATPIPPPVAVPPPPPPVLTTDVCASLRANNTAKYTMITTTCNNLWGSESTAYLTCVATMCKDNDPTTPPIPDCRVERLLLAANPNYKLPKACTEGCPNGCYGRGTCNPQTRKCTCETNWAGADCSIPTNYNKCEFTLNGGSQPNAQCQPFEVTYQDKGVTTLLTQDFSNVTVQYYDMTKKYRMKDTVVVFLVKTIDDFTTRAEQFHMVIVNNDGAGMVGGSYTMDLTFTGAPDLSNFKWANIGKGATASRAGNVITVTAAWTKQQFNGVVLFNITRGAAPQFTLRARAGSSIPQYVKQCRGTTGAIEVVKMTQAEYETNGYSVACGLLNTACNADNCKDCAALANCGWCVETGSCQPGSAAGPFVGQCFNWRFTFETDKNRRLTIIPGYPTNPRLTDVYLSSLATEELPIEIAVTAADPSGVVWDVVMFNDFHAGTQASWFPAGITGILGVMSEHPNSAVALGHLRGDDRGFNMVRGASNPRDYAGMPSHFERLDAGLVSPSTGPLDILAAVHKAADPKVNHFDLRGGARKVFLITTNRGFVPKTTEFKNEIKARLLDNSAALVFAVPSNLVATYQALSTELGLGRVVIINSDLSNVADVIPAALARAASTIGVALGAQATHVDRPEYDARLPAMSIDNVRSNMRAKFIVPVRSNTGRVTELFFPAYGRTIVETVPSDAPVGLTSAEFDGFADRDLLIELKGRSFRNLFKVTFNITRFDRTRGALFIAKLNNQGNWVKANDLPNNGELTSFPVTVPFDRVFYTPNNINADQKNWDSFDYVVVDGCTESTPYRVQLNMYQNFRPPVAEMPAPRGFEGKPMLLTLGYNEPDLDQVVVGVTRGLYDVTEGADRGVYPIGKFCAYTDDWAAGNFDAVGCQALVAPFNITPTAAQGSAQRLIYVPPYYGHSFADPVRRPELLIIPCFSYRVYEISGSKLYASNELDVQIILDHINQEPFVWGADQSMIRDAVFRYNWAAYAAGADAECIAQAPQNGNRVKCTWAEDFGEEYWWNAGVRRIAIGGYDIEHSDMEAIITAVQCPAGAILTAELDDSKNIVVGTRIPNLKSGQLHKYIKFRPAKESSSIPAGSTYCSFSYKVQDSEGLTSSSEAHVDIVINDVNKPPRMNKLAVDITVYEQRPQTFPIDAVDPEGDTFTSHLVSCGTGRGSFGICLDYSKSCDPVNNPTNVQIISCANIPSGGRLLPKTQNAPGDVEHVGVYTAPSLRTVSEGLKYESISLVFNDGRSAFTPTRFLINFNVVKLNRPPVIYMTAADGSEKTEETYSASLAMGASWSGKLRVDDADIGFGTMDLNVTIDDTFAATAGVDIAALNRIEGLGKGFKSMQPRNIQFRGSLAAVNKILASLAVNIQPEYIPESGFSTAKMIISVSDNGFTGQCPDAKSFSVRTCALTDKVEVTIQWAKPGNNNSVTVAASASAAAFAGIAAVAAAILFRKINSQAENEYEPWKMDDDQDGVQENPLFVSQGLSGSNPLFEGQQDENDRGL